MKRRTRTAEKIYDNVLEDILSNNKHETTTTNYKIGQVIEMRGNSQFVVRIANSTSPYCSSNEKEENSNDIPISSLSWNNNNTSTTPITTKTKEDQSSILKEKQSGDDDNVDGHSVDLLTELPTRLRRLVWVKRYSFVIIEELDTSSKVKALIKHVLFPEHVKELKAGGKWPNGIFIENPRELILQQNNLSSSEVEEESDIDDDGESDQESISDEQEY